MDIGTEIPFIRHIHQNMQTLFNYPLISIDIGVNYWLKVSENDFMRLLELKNISVDTEKQIHETFIKNVGKRC